MAPSSVMSPAVLSTVMSPERRHRLSAEQIVAPAAEADLRVTSAAGEGPVDQHARAADEDRRVAGRAPFADLVLAAVADLRVAAEPVARDDVDGPGRRDLNDAVRSALRLAAAVADLGVGLVVCIGTLAR